MASHSRHRASAPRRLPAFWCALVALTVRPVSHSRQDGTQRSQGPELASGCGQPDPLSVPAGDRVQFRRDAVLRSPGSSGGFAGRRALRIHNGLNLRQVRSKAARTMRKDHVIRMGHVGRLVSQKNQARMIKGLAIARAVTGRDLRLEDCGQRAADGRSRADRPLRPGSPTPSCSPGRSPGRPSTRNSGNGTPLSCPRSSRVLQMR